jgi:hypothetical protein
MLSTTVNIASGTFDSDTQISVPVDHFLDVELLNSYPNNQIWVSKVFH